MCWADQEKQVESQVNPAVSLLNDGKIIFSVKHADGTISEHAVDVLVLKLTCEECEAEHQLQEVGGLMKPTTAFLLDLANRFIGVGIEACTPTVAWQAWKAATEQMVRLGEALGEMPS